jgi:hypothetical protein
MFKFHSLLLVTGLAACLHAAGPNPADVYVQSISYGGTGCPQGSVGQSISDDRSVFTLIFDSYIASSGPSIPITESRKNCQININLHIPQGWALSIGNVTYRGYAQLPAGVTGQQSAIYYFAGAVQQAIGRTPMLGPLARDYTLSDTLPFTSLVWSGCNAVVPVNVNTQVWLTGRNDVPAQMTTDSIDGKVTMTLGFQWQRC